MDIFSGVVDNSKSRYKYQKLSKIWSKQDLDKYCNLIVLVINMNTSFRHLKEGENENL